MQITYTAFNEEVYSTKLCKGVTCVWLNREGIALLVTILRVRIAKANTYSELLVELIANLRNE